jgi:hypothetical protein
MATKVTIEFVYEDSWGPGHYEDVYDFLHDVGDGNNPASATIVKTEELED